MSEQTTPPKEEEAPKQGAIANLRGMEKEWTMIGYTFLALSIIVAMIWIFNKPLVETKLPVAKGKLPDVTLKTTTFAFVTLVLHVMTGVLSFLWMLADIVDRRNRFTWLIPYLTCCLFGQHFIPLVFYFLLGRKRPI